MAKLTDFRCKAAGPGTYSDGGGLLLRGRTSAAGETTKAWTYRYTVDGKQTWLGLGSYPEVSLQQAREKAADARKLRADGNDPLHAKRAQRASIAQQRAEELKVLTFDEAAAQYIASHRAGWRNRRHAEQWMETLATYCSPHFGGLPVGSIDLALVLKALEPIWRLVPETASRVRGRIECVLDWAKVRGLREGENPARWRGGLEHLLPRPSKLQPVRHHASLPYNELPAFMAALRERDGISARALEFLVLVASRTSEVLDCRWSEIDLVNRIWTIPGSRMKAGREHRVPLSEQAVTVLGEMAARREGELVFPGSRRAMLSNAAMHRLIRVRMRREVCAHGFRATFRTWAAERTAYPHELIEQCLAHRTLSAVELAYQRSDQLEKRRRLMAEWADFCDGSASVAAVLPLRALAM